MAENSLIAWTDHTFNPWMGCTKVSDGCKNCYAETMMDERYRKVKWGPQGKRVRTSMAYWRKALQWNKDSWWECCCGWRGSRKDLKLRNDEGALCCPMCEGFLNLKKTRQRVFCASLADVFEDNPQVADWRGELFRLIEKTPNLDWLLLTKRPEKIFSLGTDAVGEVFDLWLARNKNVWIGTSVEDQKSADERIRQMILHDSFPRVRFLSVEPLLEEVYLRDLSRFDWVIVGGESGKGCRPMDVEWARALRDECREKGVAFFMKQLGGHPNKRERLEDLPEDLRVREFPQSEVKNV